MARQGWRRRRIGKNRWGVQGPRGAQKRGRRGRHVHMAHAAYGPGGGLRCTRAWCRVSCALLGSRLVGAEGGGALSSKSKLKIGRVGGRAPERRAGAAPAKCGRSGLESWMKVGAALGEGGGAGGGGPVRGEAAADPAPPASAVCAVQMGPAKCGAPLWWLSCC